MPPISRSCQPIIVGNTQHRYPVVRLWEQNSAPLLTNLALLPFANLAQTDSPAALLEQVAAQVDMIEEPDVTAEYFSLCRGIGKSQV